MSDSQEPVSESGETLDDTSESARAERPVADGIFISDTFKTPDRLLLRFFFIVVIVNIVCLLWIAVRASAPLNLRPVLNFFFYAGSGVAVTYAALRTFFKFPFRMVELYAIVILLSLGMKAVLSAIYSFSFIGLIQSGFSGSTERLGEIFQACLLTASMMLFGGALGLRHCVMLRVEGTRDRLATIIAGMLALPAAAGVIEFPLLILRDALLPEYSDGNTPVFALFWFISIGLTVINLMNILKTLMLNVQIDQQETKWKK